MATLAACAADGPAAGPRVSTADSLGIQVVEVTGLDPAALPEWRLGAEPLVRIGEVDGAEEYTFGRITGGLVLVGGQVVVVDGQTQTLGVYDADGTFVRRLGGRGNGPGEFANVWRLRATGPTSFAVYDARLRRITSFDLATGNTDTRPVELDDCALPELAGASPFCQGIDLLAGGELLVVSGIQSAAGSSPTNFTIEEIEPRPRFLGLVAGSSVVALDTVHLEPWTNVHDQGWLWFFPTPFYVTEKWAAGLDRVVNVRDEPFELRTWSNAGDLQRIVRIDLPRAPRTEAHTAALTAAIEAGDNAILQRYIEEAEWRATVPHFRAAVLDAAGRTWLEDYWPDIDGLGAPAPSWWTVLDTVGVPAARIQAPVAEDILMIGDDRILLRETDELGVHRAAVFSIERGGPEPPT